MIRIIAHEDDGGTSNPLCIALDLTATSIFAVAGKKEMFALPLRVASLTISLMLPAAQVVDHSSTFILVGIAIAWYLASRAASAALAGGSPGAPIRRAIGHAVPGSAVAIAASWMGAPEISIGLIFASGVAALSLVAGITLLAAKDQTPMDSRSAASAVLAVAATVLTLLAGFAARFTLVNTVALAAMGLAVLAMWSGKVDSRPAARETVGNRGRRSDAMQFIAAALLAVVAAVGAVMASEPLAMRYGNISVGSAGALLLTPAVALPMIGASLDACARQRSGAAIHTAVAFVVINLGVLLPLTAGIHAVRQVTFATVAVATTMSPSTNVATPIAAVVAIEPIKPLLFPLVTWRLDSVLLVVLSLLIAPMLLGRWRLGKVEGVALVLVYLLYMSTSAIMSRIGSG